MKLMDALTPRQWGAIVKAAEALVKAPKPTLFKELEPVVPYSSDIEIIDGDSDSSDDEGEGNATMTTTTMTMTTKARAMATTTRARMLWNSTTSRRISEEMTLKMRPDDPAPREVEKSPPVIRWTAFSIQFVVYVVLRPFLCSCCSAHLLPCRFSTFCPLVLPPAPLAQVPCSVYPVPN